MTAFRSAELDDIIHGRLRLGIMTYLSSANIATFNELKAQLDASQGNLSVQLRKLEEAGYVIINRKLKERKTQTTVRMTAAGKTAFKKYLDMMAVLVEGRF